MNAHKVHRPRALVVLHESLCPPNAGYKVSEPKAPAAAGAVRP